MKRYALTLSFDGTNYAGWQTQHNADTVQAAVERGLTKLLGTPTAVVGASRTDAGVHAQGAVCHFDAATPIPTEKLSMALNNFLPPDIRAMGAREVGEAFSARFGAVEKTYCYQVDNGRYLRATLRNYAWHIWQPLDLELMRQAAQHLLGEHDFAAFCATGNSHKTTVRTLHTIDLRRDGDSVWMQVTGNAFLYNMVRIIMGTLVAVGRGDLPADITAQMLAQNNRKIGGPTAPPQGLMLMEVGYGERG